MNPASSESDAQAATDHQRARCVLCARERPAHRVWWKMVMDPDDGTLISALPMCIDRVECQDVLYADFVARLRG